MRSSLAWTKHSAGLTSAIATAAWVQGRWRSVVWWQTSRPRAALSRQTSQTHLSPTTRACLTSTLTDRKTSAPPNELNAGS